MLPVLILQPHLCRCIQLSHTTLLINYVKISVANHFFLSFVLGIKCKSAKMDPWEALAVDDSVLKEFLERCNGNTTFIPGPTRHTQAVLLNRELNETHNTQEFLNNMVVASRARDFYTNAWTWAKKFIKHHG